MLQSNTKKRFQELAGLLNEGIKLVSNNPNSNNEGTLGFFVERYLLHITSLILTGLKNKYPNLQINESDTKISENNLVVKFQINGKNLLLTSIVSYEQGSNTSVSITNEGKTEKFNLNSKHSSKDVELFIKEITERI